MFLRKAITRRALGARCKSTWLENRPEGLDLTNERLRRALLYVPCSEERKIQKSLQTDADCLIYDLEDGVSLNRKGQARQLVQHALALHPSDTKTELGVRINSIGSGLETDDLNVVLGCERLQLIMVPKVQTAQDIRQVAERLEDRDIRIVAGIETALGLLNIREIAGADRRVDALLFAAEDYCADTGITRTSSRKELYYARSVVSTTAHALRLQAIDMVTMDFRNKEVLEEESREGMEMGFTGKQAIHPGQVDLVQELFAPSKETLEKARKIVEGYQLNYKAGKGAFDLDGKAVDMPVVKWAYRVLYRAKLADM